MNRLTPPRFDTVSAYGPLLTDVELWRPFVAEVLERHGLGDVQELRAGTAGTFPTMLVADRLVVKFFGSYFDGFACAQTERELYRLLRQDPEIPAPVIIASGSLGDGDGKWDYIVSSQLSGTSYLTVRDRLTDANQRAAACFVADVARRLHALRPEVGNLRLPARDDWDAFVRRQAETCQERHRAWGTLPDRLIDGVDEYLSPIDAMVIPADRWSLLHGDLTADHTLGEWRDERWTPSGVIDFGDARIGDRMYELISLHIECFDSDSGMLRAFLGHYGREAWPSGSCFARRAMSMTLLHEFDVLKTVFDRYLDARDAPSLDALAAFLWDVDA